MNQTPEQPSWDTEALLREESWIRRIARDLVQDAARADDITQEVLSAAIRQKPRFEGAQLRAWLRTVARRAAGALRRQDERRVIAEREAVARAGTVALSNERWELHRKLHAGLQALPEDERAVLMLRYLDELSMREVGDRIGLSEIAARKRVQRARANLRQHLRDTFPSEFGDSKRSLAALGIVAFGHPPEVGLPPAALPLGSTAGLFTMKKLALLGIAVVIVGLVGARVAERWNLTDRLVTTEVAHLESPRQVETAQRPGLNTTQAEVQGTSARTPVNPDVTGAAATASRLRIVDENGAQIPGASAAWIGVDGQVHALDVPDRVAPEIPEEALPQVILASAPGFAIRSGEPVAQEDLTIVLPRRVTLHGEVRVDGERPSEELTARLSVFGSAASRRANNKLDLEELGLVDQGFRPISIPTSGQFSLEDMDPVGEGTIMFTLSYCSQEHPGQSTVHYSAAEQPWTIDLIRIPYLHGRFVWEHDGSSAEACGNAHAEDRAGSHPLTGFFSDKHGAFEIGLPRQDPGDVSSPVLISSVSFEVFALDGNACTEQTFDFDVDARSLPMDVGTIRLRRLVPREIQVLGANSQPLGGARVVGKRVYEDNDEPGKISAPLEDDEGIEVYAPGYFPAWRKPQELSTNELNFIQLEESGRVSITTPGLTSRSPLDRSARLQLTFEPAALRPRGLTHKPHGGDLTTIQQMQDRRLANAGQTMDSGGFRTWAQLAEKPLTLTGVRPGSRVLVEIIDRFKQVLAKHEAITPASAQQLDVQLTPPHGSWGTLRLNIIDEAGQLVEHTWIEMRNEAGRESSVMSGTSIDVLRAGKYGMAFSSPSHLRVDSEIYFPGGDYEHTIVLQPARIVSVRFQDEDGAFSAPDSAYVVHADGTRSNQERAPKDTLRLVSLPLETVTLVARFGTQVIRRELLVRETEIKLPAPARGKLRVRLAEPPTVGSTWAELEVFVHDLDAPNELTRTERDAFDIDPVAENALPDGHACFRDSYVSDAHGMIELTTRLQPGRYAVEVTVRASDAAPRSRRTLQRSEITIDADTETLIEFNK